MTHSIAPNRGRWYTVSVNTQVLWKRYKPYILALAAPCGGALFLLGLRFLLTGSAYFGFMTWNLTLSVFALLAAFTAAHFWKQKRLWYTVVALVVWLALLPNTFYMLTDLIHIYESSDINVLYDIVMLSLFILAGFMQGWLALYVVHKRAAAYFGRQYAHGAAIVTILAGSFAIDIGRYLRWNSWDILVNPRALLLDLSDTILNPSNYNRSFMVTGVFFIMIGVSYYSFYMVVERLRSHRASDKVQ